MAKKSRSWAESGSLAEWIRGNLGTCLALVGIAVAFQAVKFVGVYYERQARNEQLHQFCGAATAAAERCRNQLAALSSREEWQDIKPLADREMWAQAISSGLAAIKAAKEDVCKDGSHDLEGCEFHTDAVSEEMSGLSEHMRAVLAAYRDRTGTEESLRKEMSESKALLAQADKLLAGPAAEHPDDTKLLSTIRIDLSGVKSGKGLVFSDLYEGYRTASRSSERLRWLVERLKGDKQVGDDEWRVNVLNSTPSYQATFVRYTWDNTKDNPAISSSEMTAEVSKEVFDTIRSSNGSKIADTSPGRIRSMRISEEVASSIGLSTLVEASYPFSDNEGEIDLEGCSEAISVTLQFRFKGQSVERTVPLNRQDLGILFPLTAGQSFILKERGASTGEVKIPVWLAQTWSQVYNQPKVLAKGGI